MHSEAAQGMTLELTSDRDAQQEDLDTVAAELDTDIPGAIHAAHDAPNMPFIGEPEHIRGELQRTRDSS